MQKNTLRKRAAAVKAAARGRPVFVFAAHPDDAVDSDALENAITASTYATHTCGSCGTTSMVTSALKAPMCVCCGTITKASTHAAVLSATLKTEVKAGALAGVQCVHCNTVNVLPKGVVASGAIHCSTCGEAIKANAVSPDNGGAPAKLATDNPQTMTQDLKLPNVTAAGGPAGFKDMGNGVFQTTVNSMDQRNKLRDAANKFLTSKGFTEDRPKRNIKDFGIGTRAESQTTYVYSGGSGEASILVSWVGGSRGSGWIKVKLPNVQADLDGDGDFDANDIEEVDDVVMGSDEDGFGDAAGDLDDVQAKRIFASLLDDDGANSTQGTELGDDLSDMGDDAGVDPLADVVPAQDDFVDTEGFGLTAANEDDESCEDGEDCGASDDEDEDEDDEKEEASATPDLTSDNGLGDSGLNINADGTLAVTPQPGAGLREVVPNDMALADFDDEVGEDFDELPVYEGEGEPILACAGFDNTTKALSFASVGSRLVALKGHTAVAVLQPKRAKQNASVMHTEAFAQAVMAVASRSGLDKALAHFNFDHIKVPSVATTRTERQIAAFKQQAAAKEEAANKNRAECFAIAAAGLAAGKFRNEKSALASGLSTELKRLGVRNPTPIVASLLRQHGLAYAEQLVRVAANLGNMTTASRKELADMLDLVEDEGDDDFAVAETQESLDTDNDGDVDGDDFAEAEKQCADEYITSSLLQPGRVTRVTSNVYAFDAAAEARAILDGRASVFS